MKFGTAPTMQMPTVSGSALSALSTVGTVVGITLYVFSIAITYRMLVMGGHLITAYILTGIAIVVPYSGVVSTPIALAVFKYMDSKKVVPMT